MAADLAAEAADGRPSPPARTSRTARTSAKGEQTRARLIAAARTLLAGEGFARFSTRNVAALCGISHGMCHYHFQDRTDLIVAVARDIGPEWIGPMEAAVDGPGSFSERAERVIGLLTQPEGPDLSRLHSALHWFALNDDRVRAAVDAEYRRWRDCFVRLFQVLADEHEGAFDPVPPGTALAAAADGLAALQSLDSRVDPELTVRVLVAGLATAAVRP
ncbi:MULTISPECIES: TetR/AcrR family transcriptional regulator [unclassified Streptomyces]|uniref:TetR/AcrR family transcriptional regulator n=1 Tax=unclassified Streptomyces TaxID=2593676 RepID=UPI002E0D90E3|nr:TetR/AcrR family transcriptional regulator [Streptomyces sp. NBC_01296]WSW58134.1 TetR/AcrR family transcriptional regulator [Streptomyces sp. NBC_00998]